MKRNSTDDVNSQGQKHTYKRAKSIQACTNCRKHKVRCDPPDKEESVASRKCHRCKVLDLPCSLAEPDSQAHTPSNHSVTSSSSGGATRSIPSHTQPPSMPPVASARALTPETLMPIPEHPWGTRPDPSEFDWTATPLLAIQEMTRPRSSILDPLLSNSRDVSIESVLDDDQIVYLLDIFQTRYSPWLNLPTRTDNLRSPFLDLVRCMVASRHLDDSMRPIVVSRLEKLSEDAYLRQIFNSVPTEESIQALLIFSLWAPVGEVTRQDGRDNRLLAASTVSVAENLSLSQTWFFVRAMKEEAERLGGALPPEKKAALIAAKDKARLWGAIAIVESLLCVGTERQPTAATMATRSHNGAAYTPAINTVETARITRLLHMTRLMELTRDGTAIKLEDSQGFDTFFKEATFILARLSSLHRRIMPLPIISSYESFCFHILVIYCHCCKLLVLFHLTREMRCVYCDEDNPTPWYNVQRHDIAFAMEWFREAMSAAEAILTQLLSRPDAAMLGTVPDHVFILITFAAVFLIWAKISVLGSHKTVLSGYSDTTLTMTVDLLRQVKHTHQHADLITGCFRVYQDLVAKRQEGGNAVRQALREANGDEGNQTSAGQDPALPGLCGEWQDWTPLSGFNLDLDLNSLVNPSYLDSEFWPTFLSNLSNTSNLSSTVA